MEVEMKVLLSQGLARKYGEKIEKLGYKVLSYDEKNPNEKADYGEDILIGAIDLKKINYKDHKNLKYIFLTSVGIDFLDLDYIKEKEITLSNNNGAYDDPIGEWIVYGLLQINKDDRKNIENQKEKIWKEERDKDSAETAKKASDLLHTYRTVSTEKANLRAEPSVDSDILKILDKGTELYVLETKIEQGQRIWCHVEVESAISQGTIKGWISNKTLN